MSAKPIKRVAIVDCGKPACVANGILKLLTDDYEIQLTKDYNADYVIHSCMGYEVLKYSGIRIFVCGECVSPNFNISDYALAFDRMAFGDRSHWFPLIKLYETAYANFSRPRLPAETIMAQQRDFCAYVMSNTSNSALERTEIFEKLSEYKTVSSGGRWRNNISGPVSDKLKFQSEHKFAIAFENQSYPGYLTEKFAEAAQSGAIPIYWGDPTIGNYFNTKAFINCHDYPTLNAAIARIIEIDQDDALYSAMLEEPWFPNNIESEILSTKSIQSFLKDIFDQTHKAAYRRNRGRWGIKYERSLYRMNHHPVRQLIHNIRTRLRGR
ncbi:MAG TPA: hypothetical protein DCX14_10580 [Flavobacteriales bacterium]|nr:hypothetical protein [Flavobacteriales bacterium]